jgi:cytochrome b6-f complex iron-sulfur subunit
MTRDLENSERRRFAAQLVKALVGLAAIAVAGVSAVFVYPSGGRRKRIIYFDIGPMADLPERGVFEKVIAYEQHNQPVRNKLFLVRTESDLYALSSVCTHLGCLVSWSRSRETFLCPCHRGQYTLDGKVAAGPPPAPLSRMPVKIDGDRIHVGIEV